MTLLEQLVTRPPAQRRFLAVALLVMAVGLLWGAVLLPLTWVVDSQSKWRADVRHALAMTRGEADSEPALRKRAAALVGEPIWKRLYEIPNAQDATTLVQRDVMRAGTITGVTVQAVISLPKVEEAGLVGYGIRFTTTVTADQLKKFMEALRANIGYLRIERLTLSAPQIQRVDQNAALTVTMEVYGFSGPHPVSSS